MVLDAATPADQGRPLAPRHAAEASHELAETDLTFTRRNGIETLMAHWGLLAALVALLAAMKWAGVISTDAVLAVPVIVAVVVQTSAAVVVTLLVVVAVNNRHSYDQTDRWDGPSSAVPVIALLVVTSQTGGATSPVWLLVILATAYLATALPHEYRWYVAVALLAAPAASAAVAGWGDRADLVWVAALTVTVPVLYLFVRGISRALYDEAERIAADHQVFKTQVDDLSVVLSAMARGDLHSAIEHGVVGDESSGDLADLTSAMDHTLESLRGLVSRVRVG
ncbi:MAG TPA: hypothetical protein VFX15_08645, partial [Actinomycetes bacterium]|nr:hypothetical protein [Actinomycetes bacterium]